MNQLFYHMMKHYSFQNLFLCIHLLYMVSIQIDFLLILLRNRVLFYLFFHHIYHLHYLILLLLYQCFLLHSKNHMELVLFLHFLLILHILLILFQLQLLQNHHLFLYVLLFEFSNYLSMLLLFRHLVDYLYYFLVNFLVLFFLSMLLFHILLL